MGKYILIDFETNLKLGDKVRRLLNNGKYDYMIIGEYNHIDNIYEVNLPDKPRLIDAIGIYAYISKEAMVRQSYELLID